MKRLSTIIMALALVLGMSQCKKQETPTNGNGGEKVHITLNVNNGENISVNVDNGSRHDMSPRLGMVKFENGDVLYVGHDGKYIGYLTYQNGAFAGDLEAPTNTADFLHFYFLGGKGPDVESITGNPTSFPINIADQQDNLPVLCYGRSTKTYGSTTNYSAVLEYKCALVKFNLVNHVEDYYSVELKNVPTQATVNFANPTATTAIVATANQTNANMTLYGEPGNAAYRWAILLPGTSLTSGHDDLTISYTGQANLGNLANNDFIDKGISINNTVIPDAPNPLYAVKTSGDVLTKFSVGVGKKVYFSKANLKYTAAAGYSFHDTQFDEIYPALESNGNPAQSGYHSNVNLTNTSDMDRFCWGYKVNATPGGQQYVVGNHDLDSDTDWGSQLTTEGRHWRTLTADEWDYLLNSRGPRSFMMVTAVIPYGSSSYLRCQGLLLFPDGFNHTQIQGLYYSADNTPAKAGFNTAWYNKTDFTQTQIDTYGSLLYHGIDKLRDSNSNYMFITNPNSNMYKLLAAGCVFLPALGYRYGTQITKYSCYSTSYAGQGFYWTATNIYSMGNEYSKYFWFGIHDAENGTDTNNEEYVGTASSTQRNSGMCVRLVWDADPD